MNKYLLLSVAALLGSATPALPENQSSIHSIHFHSSCDGLRWYKNDAFGFQVGQHLNNDCAGGTSTITGGVNKNGWIFTDSLDVDQNGTIIGYEISKPYKTGSAWSLWICFSGGTSCFVANGGTYDVGFPARAKGQSTAVRAKELIAQLKAARRH